MKEYSDLDIDIMLGLDDIAHNRLSIRHEDGSFSKVPNYGKRNLKEKCYCKILRELGVKR